jgi:hypothetical protein
VAKPLVSSLLSLFIEFFFSMGTWEHIKLRELPRHNALGFFCWGRSLKIHTRNKKGVVCSATY